MRKIVVFALVFFALSISVKAFASPKVATFEGDPEEVFNAAVLAAQKHWNVT